MSISSVLANSVTSTSSSSSTSSTSAADQKDQFLSILLAQLQNQSPLDPMDTKEFTGQLAQYSSLEQQIDTNSKLDSLLQAFSGGILSPTSYLGQTVTVQSDTAVVQNGNANWQYTAPNAANITLTVTDAAGNVVYTGKGDTSAGTHGLNLAAGKDANGAQLKLTVTATDADGKDITPTVYSLATVDAVDSSSGKLMLEASGYAFSPDDVVRIATPSTATNASTTDESSDKSTAA